MIRTIYASNFQEWLVDRLNECARAGIEDGDIAEQLTTDFIEAYPAGVCVIEDAPRGEGL